MGLRFALRLLWKNPGFTAVAVVTLCLGIAANATVFGWIDTVLLRPIPGAAAAEELVVLEARSPEGARIGNFPHPDFRDFQREMRLVSGVVASTTDLFSIGRDDQPHRVLGQVVSANFFAVLGVKPFLGRVFRIEEDRDAPGAYPLAVISHRLWKTYFRGDGGIIGRTVRINGRPLAIIGVTPPGFRGSMGVAVDLWVPLSMVVDTGHLNTWAAADRNARFLALLVRLKPGVTIERARSDAQAVAARIAAAYPTTHRGVGASVVPVWQATQGLQGLLLNPLRVLMAVSGLVLLIACANVANLLMARSVTRQKEFGIRIALGAARWRVARQLLSEVLLLAGAGAASGLLLAQWLGESLYQLLPALESPFRAAVEPLLRPDRNWTVFAFTALVSTAAAVLAAVLPALFVSRVDVNGTLKEGGRSGNAGARAHRSRAALVVAEVALASLALIGAGLAVRSFQKFSAMRVGFDARNVLVAHMHLSTNGYSLEQEEQFCRNLRLRLEASPGIEAVSHADSVPLSVFAPGAERVQVEGSPLDREGVMARPRSVVAPGYFKLMRIPLLAGRDFTERDERTAERVIIVNQTFARRYFGAADPLGRKVVVSGRPATIVGLAQDSKYHNPPEAPTPFFYAPFRQFFWRGHEDFFYLRAAGDLGTARAALRREVAALDPATGLYEAAPLAAYTQAGLSAERVIASLLSALGMLSLALAAVGLYSVVSYAVSERTQEIGIRMALGAQRREVLALVLARGLGMTTLGLAAGIAAALACRRLLAGFSNIAMDDEPAVFAAAASFLLFVALIASYLPARRAINVDPVRALRSE